MAVVTKFLPNEKGVAKTRNGLDIALQLTVLEIVGFIQDITPRDKARLPKKNINRKDGKTPRRRGGVVNINGSFYPQVTGSLKRSIGFQKLQPLKYKVGSAQAGKNSKTGEDTNAYGVVLEFGTKYMRPRSFIRKGIIDNAKEIEKIFINNAKNKLK